MFVPPGHASIGAVKSGLANGLLPYRYGRSALAWEAAT